jgi:hypothetical protein
MLAYILFLLFALAYYFRDTSLDGEYVLAPKHAPEPTAPEPTAPEPTAPEPTAPEPTAPESTAPEPTAPELDAPETAAPEPAAPEPASASDCLIGDSLEQFTHMQEPDIYDYSAFEKSSNLLEMHVFCLDDMSRLVDHLLNINTHRSRCYHENKPWKDCYKAHCIYRHARSDKYPTNEEYYTILIILCSYLRIDDDYHRILHIAKLLVKNLKCDVNKTKTNRFIYWNLKHKDFTAFELSDGDTVIMHLNQMNVSAANLVEYAFTKKPDMRYDVYDTVVCKYDIFEDTQFKQWKYIYHIMFNLS